MVSTKCHSRRFPNRLRAPVASSKFAHYKQLVFEKSRSLMELAE